MTILLVEDDDIDRRSIKRALSKRGLENKVIDAHNGAEALEILRGTSTCGQTIDHPFLILLDINMPIMDGHEFLSELRSDSALSKSTVFVLTTSNNKRDIEKAYQHHVAGYMLKKSSDQSESCTVELVDYYIKCVKLIGE